MNDPVEIPDVLVDSASYVHRLDPERLGAGGQGIVFRTRDEHIAVKVLTDALGQAVQDAKARERLARRIENLRLLPLPDLHIATPVAMLAPPFVGYVMRLLTDMTPIRTLLARDKGSISLFYLESGGLKRRLELLARTAEILARLHAIPVVYGDINDLNVFISKDAAAGEVWLIDSDNLHFLRRDGPIIFTDRFGAPEVSRRGASTLTDVHAFAVLAFWVLGQQHPFIGEYVETGGGWDSEEEDGDLFKKAYAGGVPWIHDRDEKKNRTNKGVRRENVLSPRLWELFHATFGAGRKEPAQRPGMLRWVEALRQAADLTVPCAECRSTFYVNERTCPWCDGNSPPPPLVYVESRCWAPELDAGDASENGEGGDSARDRLIHARPVWRKVLTAGEDSVLARHVVEPTLFRDGNPPALQVEFNRQGMKLTPRCNLEFYIAARSGEPRRLSSSVTVALSDLRGGWHLHCGPVDRPHRLVSFGYFDRRAQ